MSIYWWPHCICFDPDLLDDHYIYVCGYDCQYHNHDHHIPIMHVMVLLFLWLSSIIINYHELSWIIINYHQLSSIIINYHELSSIIINYHQLSSILIKYHQVSSSIINITILFLILALHIPVGIISISLPYWGIISSISLLLSPREQGCARRPPTTPRGFAAQRHDQWAARRLGARRRTAGRSEFTTDYW